MLNFPFLVLITSASGSGCVQFCAYKGPSTKCYTIQMLLSCYWSRAALQSGRDQRFCIYLEVQAGKLHRWSTSLTFFCESGTCNLQCSPAGTAAWLPPHATFPAATAALLTKQPAWFWVRTHCSAPAKHRWAESPAWTAAGAQGGRSALLLVV